MEVEEWKATGKREESLNLINERIKGIMSCVFGFSGLILTV